MADSTYYFVGGARHDSTLAHCILTVRAQERRAVHTEHGYDVPAELETYGKNAATLRGMMHAAALIERSGTRGVIAYDFDRARDWLTGTRSPPNDRVEEFKSFMLSRTRHFCLYDVQKWQRDFLEEAEKHALNAVVE